MRKQYLIFLSLFIWGCGQSETPNPPAHPVPPLQTLNSPSADNHHSWQGDTVHDDLKRAENIAMPPTHHSLRSKQMSIDKAALNRVVDYLKSSTIAHNRAQILSSFAIELQRGYDWKRDPKSTKPYLKGGKDDLIGKLLEILTLRYNRFEARDALIEIMEKHDLLLEIIHYFTSEPILSAEQWVNLKKAIQEKNVSDIKELLDAIYVNFYDFFGKYYHTNSIWEEVKKDNTTIHQPKENGFTKQIFTLHIKGGFIPIDFEPLLHIIENIEITASDGQGKLEVKRTLAKSPLRKFIVDLLASLVSKYYGIEISQPSASR